jgi:Tfp pilus assembly protein PilF
MGDNQQAEVEFKNALKASPRDVTAHVEYAQFLEKQGQSAPALSEYKKAVEIKPDSKIAQEGVSKLTKIK